MEDGKLVKEVPSILDLRGTEFEEKPVVTENLDSPVEAADEPWKSAENGQSLLAWTVLGTEKAEMHDDAPDSVPYEGEPEITMVEASKLDVQQVNAPTLNHENPEHLFLLDTNGEGSGSGTEEEQSLFMEELEKFFRERNVELKPLKFKGKGVNYLKLWRTVMRQGGYDKVTSGKLWGQVAKSFKLPKTCKTGSRTFRSFYEKALLDFEREKHCAVDPIPSPSNVEKMVCENQVETTAKTICDRITIREIMKEVFVSGRTTRDAAARARLRWHSKCSLGNGEVSIPVVKEKRASPSQKRESDSENNGSFKRNNHSADEEEATPTIQPETAESRANVAMVDAGHIADEGKDDEQKALSSPGFASVAQLRDAAEIVLAILQTQERTLSTDTLDMLAPHLKVLMSSNAPIEVALACKRFEIVMTDELSSFVQAKRRKIELEGQIVSMRETLASPSPRESVAKSSLARKRLAGLEDRKRDLETEISRLISERAQVDAEVEEVKDELRAIDDMASKERDRCATRERLIKELALAEMSTCQGDAALASLKAMLRDPSNRFGSDEI